MIQLLFDKVEFLINTSWITRKEKLSNFKEFVQLLDSLQQKTFTLEEIKEILNQPTNNVCMACYCDIDDGDCDICEDCLKNIIIKQFEKEVNNAST